MLEDSAWSDPYLFLDTPYTNSPHQLNSDTQERMTMCLFKSKEFWENQWATYIRAENARQVNPQECGGS